ncbi:MAG: carboxylesterase/lipase family protein [Candidatus Thorarchaeota archaeon]
MVLITTKYGKIKGIQEDNYQSFLGIPYAKPPIGDLRFEEPQILDQWDDIKDATKFRPIAYQNHQDTPPLNHEESEDCLYLNVWTPSADNKERPVMFWIHGGAFLTGGNIRARFNGAMLASYGDVVVVNFNYRLGALGFLNLPNVTPNIGILDQITALKWVRENIFFFGGDPNNITIFGESAGSESVAVLLSIPESRGLFHKAIMQSGVANPISYQVEKTRKGAEEFLLKLKMEQDNIDKLRKIPINKLIRIQKKLAGNIVDAKENPFRPFIDGKIIPDQPLELIKQGKAANVPIILGWNEAELDIIFVYYKQANEEGKKKIIEIMRKMLDQQGITKEALKKLKISYESAGMNPQKSPFKHWSTILSDSMFKIPTIRQMEAHLKHQSDVYCYIFSYESILSGTAFHTLEIPFVFGTINIADVYHESIKINDKSEKLAKIMMDTWLSFARTGNPNHKGLPEWKPYDLSKRSTMIMGIKPELKEDPISLLRKAWDGIH